MTKTVDVNLTVFRVASEVLKFSCDGCLDVLPQKVAEAVLVEVITQQSLFIGFVPPVLTTTTNIRDCGLLQLRCVNDVGCSWSRWSRYIALLVDGWRSPAVASNPGTAVRGICDYLFCNFLPAFVGVVRLAIRMFPDLRSLAGR